MLIVVCDFAEEETECEYRGNRQLRWKRDLLKCYQVTHYGVISYTTP